MTTIRPALPADARLIGPLFDVYRQFYGKPAEPDVASRFVSERLANADSVRATFVSTAASAIRS